jgi:hypothetical protein
MGSFDVVVRSRMAMDERYQKYFKERQAITTIFN